MPNGTKWPYVTKQAQCAICGRPDWCQLSPDGGMALCRRVHSDKPNKKGDGWFHRIAGSAAIAPRPSMPSPATPRRNDLHLLARKFATGMPPGRLTLLSRKLRVSPESLKRLDIGWSAGEPMLTAKGETRNVFAYSFPMRDPSQFDTTHQYAHPAELSRGAVVGIRLRSESDAKYAFTGGRGGLFIPRGMTTGRVYLVEGPTDTAAALDMGLNAFGRESASAGDDLIVAFLKKFRTRFDELVIFSQRDDAKPRNKRRPELGVFYPAQEGAARTARMARLFVPSVRVVMPPEGIKDVRIWLHAGGTRADVEREVLRVPSRTIKIIAAKIPAPELEGASHQ